MEKWLEKLVVSFEEKAADFRRRGRPKAGNYKNNSLLNAYNSEASIYEQCAKEIRAGAKEAEEAILENLPKDIVEAIRKTDD